MDEYVVQSANGLGLRALRKDDCQVVMQFPHDTLPKWVCFAGKLWLIPVTLVLSSGSSFVIADFSFTDEMQTFPKRDPKSGELEGLSYVFNLCEALATWEQVRFSINRPRIWKLIKHCDSLMQRL